jgi:hypothetical protein
VYRFTVFLFYSLILPSLCLSVFYAIKINLLYVLLVYVLFILHFICIRCKVYEERVLYGRLKGIRRVVLTVSDFGFTHRLFSVLPYCIVGAVDTGMFLSSVLQPIMSPQVLI